MYGLGDEEEEEEVVSFVLQKLESMDSFLRSDGDGTIYPGLAFYVGFKPTV